ncbi:MAG: hypothetical protein AB1568_06030 [Thermodesulfobacteriota bacterium]
MSLRLTLLLILVCLVCASPPAEARDDRPPPEPGVWELFSRFGEMEESIREGKWQEAARGANDLEGRFAALGERLRPPVAAATLEKFVSTLRTIRAGLATRNREQLELPMLLLQHLLLDIMEPFAYPAPPALLVARLWVDEAGEYLEGNNPNGVAREMAELQGLRLRISEGFQAGEDGDARAAAFFAAVSRVQQAIRLRKTEQATEGLATLRSLLPTPAPEEEKHPR